jgi:UDP-N-acetylglucosamine 2-epimerase (non-hydrolysing)
VAHVEAGLRSFDREMPEETNRVIVDHVADHLFPPTRESATRLREEGLPDDRITVTGNTVADAVMAYDEVAASTSSILQELELNAGEFALLTAHRQETVDDEDSFRQVLRGVARAADRLGLEVVYPVHPRAEERLSEFGLEVPGAIRTVEPLEFFDFLRLERTAALAFTDSGGVQEETCILGTPCVTLRYGTERPETVYAGANCIAGHDPVDIVDAATRMVRKDGCWEIPFGDGNAAFHVVESLFRTTRIERPPEAT